MTPPPFIGHYRITAKLGEGGMGAVYRASDTRLNREVAIKILPEAFATDPERMARFSREAQVLASVNHPNIAAIYGVEERALVLELVEGTTLAEIIARGPIPIDEALPIARQIAAALECAHDQARGKEVDPRSDIFAFGCVLYEMLTGRAAFRGEDPVTTLAAIVASNPRPALELVPGLP